MGSCGWVRLAGHNDSGEDAAVGMLGDGKAAETAGLGWLGGKHCA
ncbi:MAG: hypothetical protein ACI3ZT_07735 [Candidatus Cryptobacteroides sp.]